MVEEVEMTRNYQITIPIEIRKKLDIRVGDKLLVYTEGHKIVRKKGDISSLKMRIGRKIADEDINEIIEEAGEGNWKQ